MSCVAAPVAEHVAAVALARGIPLAAHVDLTMRCNERCVHCYCVADDRPELTTQEILALLEDLASAGTLYLTLSGGEIFLRSDLLTVIAHAKRLRFDVRLKTNALLVSRAHADRLHELGVRHVDVSVYSADPAVHDEITRVPGSLARTLRGVAHLREAGLSVKLQCPVMARNAPGYRALRSLAERLRVPVGFDPMITARTDGDRAALALRARAPDLRELLGDPALRGERGDADGSEHDIDVPCSAGHTACYVSPYGDVMPCVAMPIACGNVRARPFHDIWRRSTALRDVRAVRVADVSVCATCAAARFCARCPGQALVEDGDLRGPSRAACEHALVAASIASSDAVPAAITRRPRTEAGCQAASRRGTAVDRTSERLP